MKNGKLEGSICPYMSRALSRNAMYGEFYEVKCTDECAAYEVIDIGGKTIEVCNRMPYQE